MIFKGDIISSHCILDSKNLVSHKNWPFVKEAFLKLKSKGYRVFLVGGVVRDLLMKRPFEDFDLVTNTPMPLLSKIFPQALELGRSFGVLKIPLKNSYIEISTFRKDGPYEDGRHPKYILTGDEKEDAQRRDFTVNSLFYDLETNQVIDHFNGLKDLNSKIIRTVGTPKKRFQEDFLRILRALRFATELNFHIEKETFLSILELSFHIQSISQERIQKELGKLFLSPYRLKGINLLTQSSLIEMFFPFYDLHKNQDQKSLMSWYFTKWFLHSLENPSLSFIFGSLFLNQIQTWENRREKNWKEGVLLCSKMLKNLKFPSSIFEGTEKLLKNHWELFEAVSFVQKIKILEADREKESLQLWSFSLDQLALENQQMYKKKKENQKKILKAYQNLSDELGKLPKAWFKGDDLKKMGWKEGKEIGRALEKLYQLQLEGFFKNRSQALSWIEEKNEAFHLNITFSRTTK